MKGFRPIPSLFPENLTFAAAILETLQKFSF